ncbi:MAG: hypothetical protein RL385_3891 [Pseudomonadota bacterium]
MRKQFDGLVALAGLCMLGCAGDVSPVGRPAVGAEGSLDAGMAGAPGAALGPAGPSGTAALPASEAPSTLGLGIYTSCQNGEQQAGPRLLRLLTRTEYANTVRDLLHINVPDVSSLPVESRVRGYDNNARSQAVSSRHVDAYLALADSLATQALREQRGSLLNCNANDQGCPRRFATDFGLRAFRRPLTEEEIARYAGLFSQELTGGDFDTGLTLALSAFLVSPHFLYRSEVGEPGSNGTYTLSPYEVASALSYLYWGTMPDDALFAAARDGRLRTAEDRAREAGRLLSDARAEQQLFTFSSQWLRSDGFQQANKDKTVFPELTDSLRVAMLEEQRRFFTKVVLKDKAPVRKLYDADFVLANGELARFYGLGTQGQDFAPVPAGDSGRGGILALGAVLAAHAHFNDTSPVKRGIFVRDRLLCQDLAPPPANLVIMPPGLDPKLSTRQRFSRHSSDAACAGCHRLIDGVGFGFEGFDGIGKRRLMENGIPVDESGSLVGLEGAGVTTEDKFRGVRELSALIADSESAGPCLALHYFRYGRGYEERASDACTLKALRERFETQSDSIYAILIGLSELDAFVTRRDP